SSLMGSTALPVTGRGIAIRASAAVADASHTPVLRRRRDDHLDEPGAHVVDQAEHEERGRERLASDSNVDPNGRVRVAHSLAVQTANGNQKEIAKLVGIIRKTPYPAVGVMQDYQGAGRRGLPLAQAVKQAPRAQRSGGDATADVAHHHSIPQ